MVAELAPQKSDIETHLAHITRQWSELDRPLCLEVRFLTADDRAIVKDVRRFSMSPTMIADAVQHVSAMNAHRLNAYVVVNPICGERAKLIKPSKGATDEDIAAARYCWADADTEQAAQNIKEFAGPKYTFAVMTGRTPHARPHVYWELEDWCQNLGAWRSVQESIAAALGTDSSVVNPSRIMRIAGTVNWPKPQKRGRGYIDEIVTIRTSYADGREPVPMERMARAFPARAAATAPDPGTFHMDTGEHVRTDYRDALRRARTDGEKHTGVRDLAASLAGQGVARGMAEAIIADACPVWDEGVEKLIDTAYAKFYSKPVEKSFDHAPAEDGPAWRIQSASEFCADFVAPEYIVDGVVQRGRLYTLTAPTGSGKTAVMLYAATALSTGTVFGEAQVEQGDVLFLAGENPDDVRARQIATMHYHGIDPDQCRVHFIAGTFSIRADLDALREAAAKLPNLVLIVVDTFAAYFDGDDENNNAQALDFARMVRNLTMIDSKPAVIMPSHPIKNAGKNELIPKGGSSLLNEVDGNLTLWSVDGAISLHWQGKLRGLDFEPLRFELDTHLCDKIRDRKGGMIPAVLAKPLLQIRHDQMQRERLSIEDQIILSIRNAPDLSVRQRCLDVGLVSDEGRAKTGLYCKIRDRLADKKLLSNPTGRRWKLTKSGEELAEMIDEGVSQRGEIDE